jgi:sugar phosphate isomerase/epimerase
MRLGFFTACLPDLNLSTIAAWATSAGFDALELAAWPRAGSRDHTASHIDVRNLGLADAETVRETLTGHGVVASALGFYENNLHPDEERRGHIHEHLRACVDAAALLGIPCVGTFVGRDPSRSVGENLSLSRRVFPPLVDYAAERGVKIAIENCPMEGWHPDGYPANLAYSPELWEELVFPLGLYLNWDPSHLWWQGIDPVEALRPYVDRVVHVQAKDTSVDAKARTRYGVFGTALRTDPWDSGWWHYRVPGRGDIDWHDVIDALHDLGYDGVVSIEHEDPVWSGTQERIKHGLELARDTLRPLVSRTSPIAAAKGENHGDGSR